MDNEKLPAISASASKNTAGVHISLVNVDAKTSQEVTIELRGGKFTSVTGRILTSGNVQDFNSFDKPEQIKPVAFKGASLKDNVLKVVLPKHSVVVLGIK